MARLGKFAEARTVFTDTTTGKRGLTKAKSEATYQKVFIGKVSVPASSAAGTGGSVRVLKATHGLDLIVGGFGVERNAGEPATPVMASLINASTMRFGVTGYTAATTYFDVTIWGTSSA